MKTLNNLSLKNQYYLFFKMFDTYPTLALDSLKKIIDAAYEDVKNKHKINMTKDELIAKQQLELEEHYKMFEENSKLLNEIHYKLFGIGQPLNDNCLMFNKEQLTYLIELNNIIEQFN